MDLIEVKPGTIEFVTASVAYEAGHRKRQANEARQAIASVEADALVGYSKIDWLIGAEARYTVWANVQQAVTYHAAHSENFEQFRADVLESATERALSARASRSTSASSDAIEAATLEAWQSAVRDLRAMTGTARR